MQKKTRPASCNSDLTSYPALKILNVITISNLNLASQETYFAQANK